MTVTLTPQAESLLRDKAAQTGQEADSLVSALIVDTLSEDADSFTEAEASQIRAGIQRGLEDNAAGRVTPLDQVIAGARAKHGFPDTWPFGVK